ncbi:conserved hypothetical protein [Hyella patelloides LEGE 07179]|uniref:Anti-sigma K factor RskA C-terminal domain-containing protein n=1 Tax=Hyella patelloides LEGE 07179 TaxID=945734 RepID=A0A563VIW1_9CYAN|nr:anti-sigma factor [Hyella patelloides]VEP11386.1 conserved hypothetical protein [Hyella patelloides LEGE 07179]
MSNNSQPHNLEEILAGYVLGDLDEAELIWLNKQLAINPALKEQIAQLKATFTLMPYGLSEEIPKTDLRSQILTKAQAQSRSSQPNRWSRIISTVTVLSTLWLGFNNYNLRQQIATGKTQLQSQQELIALLRQPNNRLVTFQGLNDVVTASGSLFISPEKKKAVLVLQNLEPLPGNQVYRLWAVSQKQKIGCANFIPNAEGTVHIEISSDEALMNASSVLITIEPRADTTEPLGSEILTGSYPAI